MSVLNTTPTWQPGITLDAMERAVILAAVRFHTGNKTQTSLALGITVNTLKAKLDRYEQEDKADAERDVKEREAETARLVAHRGHIERPVETSSVAEQDEARARVAAAEVELAKNTPEAKAASKLTTQTIKGK